MKTGNINMNNQLLEKKKKKKELVILKSGNGNIKTDKMMLHVPGPRSIRMKQPVVLIMISTIIIYANIIQILKPIEANIQPQQQQQETSTTSHPSFTEPSSSHQLSAGKTDESIQLHDDDDNTKEKQSSTQQKLASDTTDDPPQQVNGGFATEVTGAAATTTTKPVPVLRPSIEEVASKLSRKHLNLEHENWRLKASVSAGSSIESSPAPPSQMEMPTGGQSHWDNISTNDDDDDGQTMVAPSDQTGGSLTVEVEQEIKVSSQHQSVGANHSTMSQQQQPPPQTSAENTPPPTIATATKLAADHYLHIDLASGGSQAARGSANRQHPQQQQQQTNLRRKKQHGAGGLVFQQSYYEDNELFQCHQYLQYHSSSSPQIVSPPNGGGGGLLSKSPVVNAGLSRLLSSQLLPCSCESRQQQQQHDLGASSSSNLDSSTWLSCDNVQLMGSHFYTQTTLSVTNSTGSQNTGLTPLMVTRFSQRDSGLQTLHAQKFHYLQLNHLKSIDLSDNRIRLIKMDAFHGLEDKLEHLNLANNLLGDSRALTNEKLIFLSDELNRLKRLKWLSLHNNQIKQLGQTIFAKQTATTDNNNNDKLASISSSELNYLDLSENLLNFIPSDSIQQLTELRTLKLARNRIVELSQFSKFPKSLRSLDLSENLIKSIRQCNLIDLPNLIELNLSHNQLAHLDKAAFISATTASSLLSTNNLVLTPQTASGASESQSGSAISPNRVDDHHQYDDSHGPDPSSRIEPSPSRQDTKSSLQAADLKGVGQMTMVEAPTGGGDVGAYQQGDSMSLKRLRRNSDDDLRELEATIEGGGNAAAAAAGDDGDNDEVERVNAQSSHSGDLEVDESSVLVSGQMKKVRLSAADGGGGGDDSSMNSIQHLEQFNSTLKLNLSYNLFEKIPGDSLLKFTNLQQLDLSFNRIRKLDSNYLCSIYNLVENLRHLDLSGNLLSTINQNNSNLSHPDINSGGGRWHLNRLFGCLQRLEKLLLSTNRLAATPHGDIMMMKPAQQDVASGSDGQPVVLSHHQTASSLQESDQDYPDQLSSSESNINEQTSASGATASDNRLTIKFGEGFGSRFLNTLDLSDNQLKSMPIIEQVSQNPIVSLNMSSNIGSHNQSHLNQWMNSRMYLEILNLNYNSIERLDEQDFEHLFNLHHLTLDFNKLSQLPIKLMRQFTSLDRLSLQGNMITQISPLNELFERSTRTLRLLNLANNRLTEWPQMIKLTQHDASNGAANSYMIVDNDSFASQAIRFALEELNLEGNQFTSDNVTSLFDQLLYMRSLKILNLKYNQLQRVKSEWFKFANRNLQTLLLTGNRINTIDLGSLAWNQVNELLELNLDYNLLRELRRKTFDSMPRMRQLNLANNLIHTIQSEAFYQVNSLQVLKLNNNKLTSWKCEYFSNLCNPTSGAINADLASLLGVTLSSSSSSSSPSSTSTNQQENPTPSTVSSLVELDLSHNSLSQLRANSIAVHTKLTKLNLSHNKLSFIPHDLFKVTTSGQLTGRQIHLVSSIRYLNLAHNHIQTIDNINFRPMKNLLALDLSYNELQTLGMDVVLMDSKSIQQHENNRRIIISNNLTNLPLDDEFYSPSQTQQNNNNSRTTNEKQSNSRQGRQFIPPATNWPSLSKLRHLNVANNQLTMVNQSLINELSPFALLNLNLSFNYLDSESLPYGFYTKINSAAAGTTTSKNIATGSGSGPINNNNNNNQESMQQIKLVQNYDLVFTLKLESLDLSHNRLNEFPTNLLDNHYTSMESCNLSHNRIQNLAANSNLMIQIKSLNLEFNPLNRESNELVLFEQRSVRSLNMAATRLYAIQQATLATDQFPSPSLLASNPKLKFKLANQTSQLDLIRSISKPIDAPHLRHLNLSSNQLVWLAANVFDRMHSLETLDLSNNQLTRLNLLNNQLIHVSSTLEYLNMGSNLFTSIDLNDFNQLTKLRHLDLSNLLSLQKMNCKFLSKLGTLKTLKMFNYPKFRHNIDNMLTKIMVSNTSGPQNGWPMEAGNQDYHRMQLKLMDDLVYSSIGRHCFQDNNNNNNNNHHHYHQQHYLSSSSLHDNVNQNVDTTWMMNLEQLELELFNNFHNQKQQQSTVEGGGFKLRDELSQLLGPHLRKLSLFGLNLTSLSDDSLFGITSDELNLKISYTSMTQLPLRQLLFSLAKRTKLNLDFRNNNIQSVDTRGLQLLDELQSNNQVLQRNDQSSSLRLASNPIRCDCQTRPLWLWLNQRWAVDSSAPSGATGDGDGGADIQAPPSSLPGNPNYWLNSRALKGTYIATSDLKCYYPIKLRGKLTQNVNYNDLVCKGGPSGRQVVAAHQSFVSPRKRNETRHSSDSYYITSSSSSSSSATESDLNDANNQSSNGEDRDDDYLDFAETIRSEASVRVTKFNKYPANYAMEILNSTSQLWSSVNVPPAAIRERPTSEFYRPLINSGSKQVTADAAALEDGGWNRKDRRASSSFIEYASDYASGLANNQQQQQQQVNINFNKHRPNLHQRHSHYDTVSSFQVGGSQASAARGPQFKLKHHSLLSDIDVLILAVSSAAMIVMSFIIIIICLFKYRLDHKGAGGGSLKGGDQILLDSHQGQAFLAASQAAAAAIMLRNNNKGKNKMVKLQPHMAPCGMKQVAPLSFSSSSDNSPQSSSNDVTKLSPTQKARLFNHHHHHHRHQLLKTAANTKQKLHNHHQILVPMGSHPNTNNNTNNSPIIAPAENFLMRSPTIRRMHGFATNASDWFKFTLRAYPPDAAASGSGKNNANATAVAAAAAASGAIQHHRRRRHLFIARKNPIVGGGGSQLTTAQLINHHQQASNQLDVGKSKLQLPVATLCSAGCPLHAFESLHRLKEQMASGNNNKPARPPNEPQCQHCDRLVAAVERNYHGAAGSGSASSVNNTNESSIATAASGARPLDELKLSPASLSVKQATSSNSRTSSDGASDQTTIPKTGVWSKQVNLEQQHANNKPASNSISATIYNNNNNNNNNSGRNRPLRTFGSKFNQSSTNSSKIYNSQQQQQQQHHSISGHLVSQIPSVDIEGRFAYQSDSHFDSPSAGSNTNVNNTNNNSGNSQQSSRPNTRMGERCSSFVGNREEMFMLVHDNNSSSLLTNCDNNNKTIESHGIHLPMGAQLAEDSSHRRLSAEQGGEFNSSMMNDECSQSSSPVAYGFMRSSPSATTLSSMTTAQNNSILPHNTSSSSSNHHHHHHHSINSYKNINDTTTTAVNNNNININNNNNTGYWVHRKAEMREMPPQPPLKPANTTTTTETKTDDQIIISRL